MEQIYLINLLPWREKRQRRRHLGRIIIATLIALCAICSLFFIYEKEAEKEPLLIEKKALPYQTTWIKSKQQWVFLKRFFIMLTRDLPDRLQIRSLSEEKGVILLQASLADTSLLHAFLSQLKKQFKKASIQLVSLSEEKETLFTIAITPELKTIALNEKVSTQKIKPFDASAWSTHVASFAQKYHLILLSLKPQREKIEMLLQGDYAPLIRFLFSLQRDSTPLLIKQWHLKPKKQQLELELNAEVIHS